MRLVITEGGRAETVEVVASRAEPGRYTVRIGGEVWEVDARSTAQGIYSLLIGGESYVADVADRGGISRVEVRGEVYEIEVEEESRHIIRTRGAAAASQGGQVLRAPLPGKITEVRVEPGRSVSPGDTLVVIEAMKMENEFKATRAGRVREVRVARGQAVNAGDVLLLLE